jgi:hypothetical protein
MAFAMAGAPADLVAESAGDGDADTSSEDGGSGE